MANMVFLDFEKPLEGLFEQMSKLEEVNAKGDVDMSDTVKELKNKIKKNPERDL